MARRPERTDVDWKTADHLTAERICAEVLMDIRAELRRIRAVLECPNTTKIPTTLHRIALNTAKPRKRKAAATPLWAVRA